MKLLIDIFFIVVVISASAFLLLNFYRYVLTEKKVREEIREWKDSLRRRNIRQAFREAEDFFDDKPRKGK